MSLLGFVGLPKSRRAQGETISSWADWRIVPQKPSTPLIFNRKEKDGSEHLAGLKY
jgi:hypothetical protein